MPLKFPVQSMKLESSNVTTITFYSGTRGEKENSKKNPLLGRVQKRLKQAYAVERVKNEARKKELQTSRKEDRPWHPF